MMNLRDLALLVALSMVSCEEPDQGYEPTEVSTADSPLGCPPGWMVDEEVRCVPTETVLIDLGSDGTQGLVGIVSRVFGNCEPPISRATCREERGPRRVIVRQSEIHLETAPCLLENQPSDLIRDVPTTERGEYLVNLPVGDYWVFGLYEGCEACGAGCRVTVETNSYAVHHIIDDQDAVY